MTLARALINIFNRCYSSVSSARKLVLYGDDASPPVRFVKATAFLLNVRMNFHNIDLFKGEHMTEFYKKINPLQKVPALLIDGKKVISDSHAIALYLCRTVDSTGKKISLYPKDDDVKQAIVDRWLYYNASVLFPANSIIYNHFFGDKTCYVDEHTVLNWFKAVDHLEEQLAKTTWLSGDQMRLCDLCCYTTASSMRIILPLKERHTFVKEWMNKLNVVLASCDTEQLGLERLRSYVNQRSASKCRYGKQ